MAYSGTLIRSGNNAKTIKGDDVYETAIMYLAPFKLAALGNTCPMAELAGCVAGCLNTAGRGAFSNVQQARINKTKRYFASRVDFMAELVKDLEKFVRYCKRNGVKPAVRLNGTSDIQWETAHPCYREVNQAHPQQETPARYASIFHAFPEVQFYDYTKVYKRVYKDLPSNYTLVLSYSEANQKYADAVEKAHSDTGCNVAVVYRDKKTLEDLGASVPFGYPCKETPIIDGDETDMRFLDPKGVIVGLYAKGAAKKDTSGFVIG